MARYKYDSLNRLVREDNKPMNKTVLFTYDTAGNITERCEYAYTSKMGEELSELVCTHFGYDYEGDRLVSYNGESVAYNVLSNPTSYRGNAIEWQYGNRLTKYGTTTFAYDGAGRRVSKGNISFTYDSNGRLIKQSNGLEFIYDNSGVIGLKYNNAQYFYRRDCQGNIIALIDSSGNVVVEYKYDAWGNHEAEVASEEYVTLANLNPFRYRGYYYDSETGLYFLQTRYYDPEVGRFISRDSIEYADPETICGLNLYAYCGNNPVMNVDPSGEFFLTFLLCCLIGGTVAGAIVGGASAALNGENIWDGIWKGALTGLMLGTSVVLIGAGLTAPLAGTIWASIAIGAGVGSAFALGVNINSQLQNGGFGSFNIGEMFRAWGTGAVIGGLAGGTSFALKLIGQSVGAYFGLSLSGKYFLGKEIGKIISKVFLSDLGEFLGGAAAGFLGNYFINKFATDTALQKQNIPMWLGSILKIIFGR